MEEEPLRIGEWAVAVFLCIDLHKERRGKEQAHLAKAP